MPVHECMIIANPEGKAWEFAYSIYKNLNARDKKYYLNELHIKRFRDNEIKVKIKDNVRRKNCFFVHDSSLEPAEWLMQLAFVNEALDNSPAQEVIDVLPYLKFSRQDRKDESRVAVNARSLAEIIEIHANRVLTIDAHSSLIPSFYRIPFDNLYSSKLLHEYLKERHPEFLKDIVIMSPDPGGTSRAKAFANELRVEDIVIGYKHRPREGEIGDYKIIGNVSEMNVLMIDDIVDSGNTLIKAAEEARKEGARKVFAYCTHGVFSGNAREDISKKLDLMIVSNSISQELIIGDLVEEKEISEKKYNIEVMPLEDFFAEAIYRTNEGKSLSELFE